MLKCATKVSTLFILENFYNFLKSKKKSETFSFCCAFEFFRRGFSESIPSRNGKQVLWGWLKILYNFAMNFIFPCIWYEIRITGFKMTIGYNDSEFLRVSSIKWWYPLNKGTCFFTEYFDLSRNIRFSL